MPTYLRLRSNVTGHEWDASYTAAVAYLASGGADLVSRHPPRIAANPRPAKPLRDLAGKPARPRRSRTAGQSTSKERQ